MSAKLSIHPAIIMNLITGQAGTLGKALLEFIMNAVDAQATCITIKLNQQSVTVVDDGMGFKNRAEIDELFGVLGFPHDEKDHRVYGRYGIGRAQIWAFASTVWRTNEFLMDVDIKHRGLDYTVRDGLPKVPGVQIEGRFYEALPPSQVIATERELAELAKYVSIPVVVNGKTVSTAPNTCKWHHETDEAWINVTDAGNLSVYNLGVLVRAYPAYMMGVGGTVVTKPGVRLSVNMARNDVLVAQCAVWKKIKPFLERKGDEERARKPRQTEDDRRNIALRLESGSFDDSLLREAKVITDTTGAHHAIRTLFDRAYNRHSQTITVEAEVGSQLAHQAHKSHLAFVLSRSTLDRFGVTSVTQLAGKLTSITANHAGWYDKRVQWLDNLADAAPALSDSYHTLAAGELKADERGYLHALSKAAEQLTRELRRHQRCPVTDRSIHLGVSDCADAWTDGRANVTVNRRMAPLVKQGLPGCIRLACLLLHEFKHDNSDAGSHIHDVEFYERFHDIAIDSPLLGGVASEMLRAYISYCQRHGGKITRAALNYADLEAAQIEFPDARAAA